MKIAVISDLHLGRGDAADRFGHDDAEFLRFLDYLEGDFERIVLLGDIYETLTSPKPLAQVEELAEAKAAHAEIAARFATPRYRYIHGNHDLVAGHVEAAPSSLELTVDGTKLLFTHGHHHDWMIRRLRWLSEAGVWAGGWLLRMGVESVIRFFDRMDNVLAGVSRDPKLCSFQRWAVANAEARDADIVVTGHTHVGVRAEHGERLFLNSGSCAQGKFSYLSLDTARGDYSVNASW
jgi:predicted phosphodiesterase